MPAKKSVLNSADMEIAISFYFNPRVHLIVPNISHGMYLHECDLLVMNGQNYGVEVEIKISKADIKKDMQKRHGHNSDKIRRLFFAIPEFLYTDDVIAMIPERAGIFVVTEPKEKTSTSIFGDKSSYIAVPKCILKRNAKINKNAIPFSDKERINMGRLGMLRYWSIRTDNYRQKIQAAANA